MLYTHTSHAPHALSVEFYREGVVFSVLVFFLID